MAAAVVIAATGCSERASEPVILPDSTIVFPAKKGDGISATITLCRKVIQKTGKRIGMGTIFSIREDGNVYAFIDLENRFVYGDKELMFHLDWIDPEGKSFYQKRIDLSPTDSSLTINSSISVAPGKRQAGEYFLRVYFFRELVAEKKFELQTEDQVEKVTAKITFFKNIDKETGIMNGVDTVFSMKKKGIVRASIDLANLSVYQDEELSFQLDWIGPDGKSFYKKQIDLLPVDSFGTINSSISISPDKRQPGKCLLKVYLFDEVIAEKRFELRLAE